MYSNLLSNISAIRFIGFVNNQDVGHLKLRFNKRSCAVIKKPNTINAIAAAMLFTTTASNAAVYIKEPLINCKSENSHL